MSTANVTQTGGAATVAVTVSRGLPGPSGSDATVTNANVNTAIEVNPSASRTSLGLGTLATQSGTFSGESSGTNTGDQDLSGLSTPATVAAQIDAASRKYLLGNRGVVDSLKTTLDAGYDAAIGVITDSTGNGTDEWVYLVSVAIGAEYPNHRVEYRLWNDSTKKYDLTTIQSGVGGDRHINYPASSTFGYFHPSSSVLESFTDSDIEIHAEISLDAGGFPSTSCVLLNWHGSTAGRGWLQLGTTGFLQLNWSEDASGSTAKTANSTVAFASLVAGTKYTFRATLDIDNGAGAYEVKFYSSTNGGSTWTQLGSTVTGPSTTTIVYPSGAALLQNSRGSAPTPGVKFYRAQIYKGLTSGQPLLPERIDLWQRNTSSPSNPAGLAGAPVLYIDNIANSGWGLDAHIASQTAPQTAYIERGRLFWALSSGHNDQGMLANEWGRKADALMSLVWAKSVDNPPVLVVTQNTQTPGVAAFSESHNRRLVSQLRVASARNWPVIDVAGAWRDYGDTSAIMNADGIHPLAAGSELTRDAILASLGY
jgi:hypothetical protein